jgi:hypothetical protein
MCSKLLNRSETRSRSVDGDTFAELEIIIVFLTLS